MSASLTTPSPPFGTDDDDGGGETAAAAAAGDDDDDVDIFLNLVGSNVFPSSFVFPVVASLLCLLALDVPDRSSFPASLWKCKDIGKTRR